MCGTLATTIGEPNRFIVIAVSKLADLESFPWHHKNISLAKYSDITLTVFSVGG